MELGAPAERFIIDLTGPCGTSVDVFIYIFTAMCPFSKNVIAVPIRSKDAHTVTRCIVENIFLRFSKPFEILSDRGTEFENELAKELYDALTWCLQNTLHGVES